MGHVDWSSVFAIDTPVLEIFVRGTVMYLGLFLLLRIVAKREAGSADTSDLLVIVVLADAAQNAMAGEYRSLPDGLLLVSTILFWSHALNFLGYHVGWIGRWIHGPPLRLIRDGQLLRRNLRRELLTREELMSLLRQQGVDDPHEVKAAWLESSGDFTVIKKSKESGAGRRRRASLQAGGG